MHGKVTTQRDVIRTLKGWNGSDIWEQPKRIKLPSKKKLKVDKSQGMLAIIQCRLFCLPFCYPTI
jgi:hypothetical protein